MEPAFREYPGRRRSMHRLGPLPAWEHGKNCLESFRRAGWPGWKLQSEADNRRLVQRDSLHISCRQSQRLGTLGNVCVKKIFLAGSQQSCCTPNPSGKGVICKLRLKSRAAIPVSDQPQIRTPRSDFYPLHSPASPKSRLGNPLHLLEFHTTPVTPVRLQPPVQNSELQE